jgi:hypothetical protein
MGDFKGPYRRKDFSRNDTGGTYVTVYQRPNEEPMLDFNFMDGDHDVETSKEMIALLEGAVRQAEEWSK